MTTKINLSSYFPDLEAVSANYRLESIKALIKVLEYEQTWSASNRKAVTLALLNHALTNTEADLSDTLNYDADNNEDPWDFASSGSTSDSVAKEPQSAQIKALDDFDNLCDLAINHLRLNPLFDKRKISELVVTELCEMGAKFVKGIDLIGAIDHAFAQRMIGFSKPIDISICADLRGLGLKLSELLLKSQE